MSFIQRIKEWISPESKKEKSIFNLADIGDITVEDENGREWRLHYKREGELRNGYNENGYWTHAMRDDGHEIWFWGDSDETKRYSHNPKSGGRRWYNSSGNREKLLDNYADNLFILTYRLSDGIWRNKIVDISMEELSPKLTYSKNSDGNKEGRDENGNRIHFKQSDGFEVWCAFDSDNEIYQMAGYINNEGNFIFEYEKWFDHDGNVIRYKKHKGFQKWFDSNGNLVRQEDADGNDVPV
ncbi:MAG: hypothetical protein KZQ83_06685 [gamma proteobacterium symbiont of Taylorina sp.]|nr:hypothetical protein [gamma proteobacterium symbiont of Taylorina sp.]